MKIEVEKKFLLTPKEIARLTAGAEFLGEKVFTDIYYDTLDYSLAKTDRWLRKRAGKFELKLPMDVPGEERILDQYTELETELEIKTALELPLENYLPFCTIQTTRQTFRKDVFTVDINTFDFGYKLTEIELIVDDPSEIPSARSQILKLTKSMGFTINPVRGKMMEYLSRNNPVLFQSLHTALSPKTP